MRRTDEEEEKMFCLHALYPEKIEKNSKSKSKTAKGKRTRRRGDRPGTTRDEKSLSSHNDQKEKIIITLSARAL
jgi:hypothetical protein